MFDALNVSAGLSDADDLVRKGVAIGERWSYCPKAEQQVSEAKRHPTESFTVLNIRSVCRTQIPDERTLLNIVNNIFQTKCEDVDAIEATGAWEIILEELNPSEQLVAILVLRYQFGMTVEETSRTLGISVSKVSRMCVNAFSKLRHPCRITRIRNSVMGWPNLYRD